MEDKKLMQAIYVGLLILAVFLFMWMSSSSKHMELANHMAIKYNMSLVDYIALKNRMSVKEYTKWKTSMAGKEHLTMGDVMTRKDLVKSEKEHLSMKDMVTDGKSEKERLSMKDMVTEGMVSMEDLAKTESACGSRENLKMKDMVENMSFRDAWDKGVTQVKQLLG